MKTDLESLRATLPTGPTEVSALDRIVEQLSDATNSNGLHEKLVRWGWISPDGYPRTWRDWRTPQY